MVGGWKLWASRASYTSCSLVRRRQRASDTAKKQMSESNPGRPCEISGLQTTLAEPWKV